MNTEANPDALVPEQGLEEKSHVSPNFTKAAACTGDFLFPEKWDKHGPSTLLFPGDPGGRYCPFGAGEAHHP